MFDQPVLIVIDVQNGFRNPAMPPSNNPECEDNVRKLLSVWRERGLPVVLVRHDSKNPSSVLAPGQSGNDLQEGIEGDHDLLVSKSVNSAFYGEPDLKTWLDVSNCKKLVICGIQTNYCCETTARMAGNMGYEVEFVLDAMRTFDLTDDAGKTYPAELLHQVTAVNLDGEFAKVVTTDQVCKALAD